jgi:quinol monooxygenase YgiN
MPVELMGIEGYQLHSAEEPGTFISMTTWEDQAQMAKMMQNEWYANLVKEKLMPLLVAPPERAGFHVLGHTYSADYKK